VNRIAVMTVAGVLTTGAMLTRAAEQKIDPPQVRAGDTWTYRMTDEKGPGGWGQSHWQFIVTRVTGSTIYLTTQQSGSTQPPREIFRGSDWSVTRDMNGKETVIERPLAFPLSEGKAWKVTYTDDNPGKNFRTETWDDSYRVVGYETIEVPAGKFQALKIEAEGRWSAQLAPGQNVVQAAHSGESGTSLATNVQNVQEREVSGRLYKAFWYAPEVKRWVKSIEEDYSSGGVRNARHTAELESFKPAS
jgi:hypothetical protein